MTWSALAGTGSIKFYLENILFRFTRARTRFWRDGPVGYIMYLSNGYLCRSSSCLHRGAIMHQAIASY
jgi:hypothetical protein